jgi:hypothetical protein
VNYSREYTSPGQPDRILADNIERKLLEKPE